MCSREETRALSAKSPGFKTWNLKNLITELNTVFLVSLIFSFTCANLFGSL